MLGRPHRRPGGAGGCAPSDSYTRHNQIDTHDPTPYPPARSTLARSAGSSGLWSKERGVATKAKADAPSPSSAVEEEEEEEEEDVAAFSPLPLPPALEEGAEKEEATAPPSFSPLAGEGEERSTARESPKLATARRVGVTSAMTAVEPEESCGVCVWVGVGFGGMGKFCTCLYGKKRYHVYIYVCV